jgi:hypothetical protein
MNGWASESQSNYRCEAIKILPLPLVLENRLLCGTAQKSGRMHLNSMYHTLSIRIDRPYHG